MPAEQQDPTPEQVQQAVQQTSNLHITGDNNAPRIEPPQAVSSGNSATTASRVTGLGTASSLGADPRHRAASAAAPRVPCGHTTGPADSAGPVRSGAVGQRNGRLDVDVRIQAQQKAMDR